MGGNVSRRSVLTAAAALAAAPALLPVAAHAAAASQPLLNRTTLAVGANSGWYEAIYAEVPQISLRRVYYGIYDDVPAQWPAQLENSAAMVSIRPIPADLLAGRLDTAIRAFAESAPPGSGLTAWHEAGNLAGYPAYINPRNMRAVHAHMQRLCNGTNVKYGPILCMHPSHMPPWLVPGLDWYGLDIYDWPEFHYPDGGPLDIHGLLYPRLDQWRQVIQRETGRAWPVLNICETNSIVPSHRAKWFTAVAAWMSANGGGRMLSYWNDQPGTVGPWIPGDTAVIQALAHASTLPR